jgi:hypothetical protein
MVHERAGAAKDEQSARHARRRARGHPVEVGPCAIRAGGASPATRCVEVELDPCSRASLESFTFRKGKALLQAGVEGILLDPSPDGYAVRVSLKKTNPAALGEDSGVGDSQTSCGGGVWSKADLLMFAPPLTRRPSRSKELRGPRP